MKYPAGSVSNDREKGVHTPQKRAKRVAKIESPASPHFDRTAPCRTFECVIREKPVAYTRMTQASKHHDPAAARYLTYQQIVRAKVREMQPPMLDGPLSISVIGRLTTRLFDASNLLKGIEDALQVICFHNDKQMIEVICRVYEGYAYDAVYVRIDELDGTALIGGDHHE